VNDRVAIGGGDREPVWVPEVAHDSFDVLKRARVGALTNVCDDLMSCRVYLAHDGAADESSCPRDQTAHARLVTGSSRFTKRYDQST
jgi:hypothetical protein